MSVALLKQVINVVHLCGCRPKRTDVSYQLKCSATLVLAKCIPHCSVVLCKTGSQQACVTATAPMEICSSYRCAVSQLKCSATLVWAKCIPHCSVVLCKTGSQQACVSAIAPVEILSSYRCAVSQQKCSPALVWAKCIPHCSAKQAHSRRTCPLQKATDLLMTSGITSRV